MQALDSDGARPRTATARRRGRPSPAHLDPKPQPLHESRGLFLESAFECLHAAGLLERHILQTSQHQKIERSRLKPIYIFRVSADGKRAGPAKKPVQGVAMHP